MYVRVNVVADARKESVVRKDDTTFQITVKEPAERNLANKRIREILAEEFKVSVTQVSILTGHRSPSKMCSIELSKDGV